MTRIHQDGKVLEPTGEFRPPKKWGWFMVEGMSGDRRIVRGHYDHPDVPMNYRHIYRELPEEPSDEKLLTLIDYAKENDELRAENKRLTGILEAIKQKAGEA